MIDKKHAVQNIAVTETMTLSLFSLIISYLLALSSLFGHTSWPFADNSVEEIKSLPLIKVKCTTTAVTLHVSVIFWPQTRCSTVSQDVLHVIHHMNCCLPLPPAKKPSNVWLPIFSSKMWWQAAKFQKFVQTRNSNIRDQRYRYHCCVPGSCLGGSNISQVNPHMGWIKSYGG